MPAADLDSLEVAAFEQRAARRYEESLASTRLLLQLLKSRPEEPAWRAGDARRGVEYMEQMLALPPERRALAGDADSLLRIFEPLYHRGAFDTAAVLARQELELRRATAGDSSFETANSYNNIANTVQELGLYAEALAASAASMRIILGVLEDDHPALDATLNNLAALYDDIGKLAESEALYRKSLAISRAQRDSESIATGLNNLGLNLERQGNDVEAVDALGEAVDIRRRVLGEEDPLPAQARLNHASVMKNAGELTLARETIERAIAVLGRPPIRNRSDFSKALQVRGSVEFGEGRFAAAESTFRHAMILHARVTGKLSSAYASARINWSRSVMAQRRYAAAEASLATAERILRTSRGQLSPDHIECVSALGDLAFVRGRTEEAARHYADAARAYDVVLEGLVPGQTETLAIDSPFPRLALALLRLGREDEAWPAAERYLARGLASQLLGEADAGSQRTADRSRLDSLDRALSDAHARIDALQAAGPSAAPEESQRAARGLELAEARWIEFQLEARRAHAATHRLFTLQSIQEALAPDEVILGWLIVDTMPGVQGAYAYLIRQSGPVEWIELPEARGRTERARATRLALRQPGYFAGSIGWTWEHYLAPVMPRLAGARCIIAVPSSVMLGVPVEAIAGAGQREFDSRFEVTYSPSATMFAWLRARRPERARAAQGPRVLCFADPPFSKAALDEMRAESRCGGAPPATRPASVVAAQRGSAGDVLGDSVRSAVAGNHLLLERLPRLRSTRRELETLERLAGPGSRLYAGPASTEAELVKLERSGALRDMDIIHFATHALVDEVRPERSALVLSQVGLADPLNAAVSGERIFDGLVSVREILHEWHLGADLVTLSACETGLGRESGGEGYLGLADACLRRGARSVLVSLWQVDDRVTALLMQFFYEALLPRNGPGLRKSEALAQAKARMKDYRSESGVRPYSAPYYWAGFVLLGAND